MFIWEYTYKFRNHRNDTKRKLKRLILLRSFKQKIRSTAEIIGNAQNKKQKVYFYCGLSSEKIRNTAICISTPFSDPKYFISQGIIPWKEKHSKVFSSVTLEFSNRHPRNALMKQKRSLLLNMPRPRKWREKWLFGMRFTFARTCYFYQTNTLPHTARYSWPCVPLGII